MDEEFDVFADEDELAKLPPPVPRIVQRNPRKNLSGISPNERGLIKRQKVLRWLYIWHKTSASIIQKILGTSQRDYMTRLEADGLVQKVVTPGLPVGHVWMLTRDGLAMAIQLTGDLLDYDTRPASIDLADLRHDLAVQMAALNLGELIDMKPERLLGADAAGQKRPDAILAYRPVGAAQEESYECALEVEFTHKKSRELDQALLAAAGMIERMEVGSVRYVSHSPALLDNYRKTLAAPLNIWEKSEVAKKWVVTKQVRVSQWVIDSFEWVHDESIFAGLFFKRKT